ncbi:uncharacterized protein LOC117642237 [Thrips palmi]|uniref:Uncharacterized protein LOC117642237 n=1 Tax=Thrips palmi TaxID=161013 RepID=A0A6P8ZJX0_THRPL|nr:uncharacterized protein LOC117642237 [Thrips palmi]
MDPTDSTTAASGTVPPTPSPHPSSAFTASSTGSSSTPWDPPILPLQERADHTAWYWALGGGGLCLALLFVLAVLYRRGLIFQGSAWKRRPSHAQPWKHWGDARSRLPSLFDLLHVPQHRKSTVNAPVSLPAAEAAYSTSTPMQHADAATVRVQLHVPARSYSSVVVHLRDSEEPPGPPSHYPGKPLGAINE